MNIKSIQKRLIYSGIAGALTLGVAASAYAGQGNNSGCTLDSFNGSYAFTETGTIGGGIGRDVEVGIFTSDGDGAVEGHGTLNIETLGILHAEFTDGTYTLDADCTGVANFTATLTATADNLIGVPAGFVVSSGPRALAFAIQTAGNIVFIGLAPGDSLSGSARKAPGN